MSGPDVIYALPLFCGIEGIQLYSIDHFNFYSCLLGDLALEMQKGWR